MNIHEIAESFDKRSATYAGNDWHKRCAERLVFLCQLRPGYQVLDAGTGTGFAAMAAARAVGTEGHVRGVDVSSGMLREARIALSQSDMTNVDLIQADAGCLPQFESGTFDAITCAAGLLYMPVSPTLREWHRLLKRGGLVAFSTMHTDSPPAARIFRDCAAAFGVLLQDASEPLGSVISCRNILEQSGFEVANLLSEVVEFSAQDLKLAWESNSKSAAHAAVLRLTAQEQLELKGQYLDALTREERERPGALRQAKIIYAVGRR